ncbi:apelin [Gadus morhua]|uniref:apelin n=1 Tax=Gadus morhua TaxID=8049 RepID=UPI0011B43239|nr:apelin-like [Gadus morhua]
MSLKMLFYLFVCVVSDDKDWSSSPMASTDRGRALEAGAPPRRVPPQNPGRGGQTHRPAGWKRRRPRPRLSHKGPMPF